eukprot:2927868-Pyramimonas_sp.AAC.1
MQANASNASHVGASASVASRTFAGQPRRRWRRRRRCHEHHCKHSGRDADDDDDVDGECDDDGSNALVNHMTAAPAALDALSARRDVAPARALRQRSSAACWHCRACNAATRRAASESGR